MYPVVSKTIEQKLRDDPNGFIEQAEKEMAKQNAIIASKAEADKAENEQREAKENL